MMSSTFKKTTMALALIMGVQTAALPFAHAEVSKEREQQILEMAEKNPKQLLASMTDEELRQAAIDMKATSDELIKQLAIAQANRAHDEKVDLRFVEAGGAVAISTLVITAVTLGRLTALEQILKQATFYRVSNPLTYLYMAGMGVALTLEARGIGHALLRDDQVDELQERLHRVSEMAKHIDARLAQQQGN